MNRKNKASEQHKKEIKKNRNAKHEQKHNRPTSPVDKPPCTQRDESNEPSIQQPVNETENFSAKYSKRVVKSNSSRYEECPDVTEQTNQNNLSLYEEVLMTSRCSGGHFQFDEEKKWELKHRTEWDRLSDIFTLDLKVLEMGLSCLPFYKRIGVDATNFSIDDLNECDKIAKEGRLKLGATNQKFELQTERLNDCNIKLSSKKKTDYNKNRNPMDDQQRTPAKTKLLGNESSDGGVRNIHHEVIAPEEVDKEINNLSTKIENLKTDSTTLQNKNAQEDLEDWLDSVLSE